MKIRNRDVFADRIASFRVLHCRNGSQYPIYPFYYFCIEKPDFPRQPGLSTANPDQLRTELLFFIDKYADHS